MLGSYVSEWLPRQHMSSFAFASGTSLLAPHILTGDAGSGLARASASTNGQEPLPQDLSTPAQQQQPLVRRKRHRADQIEAAYELQRNAAIKGAVMYTVLGLGGTFFAHHLFPRFRFQTLALKAFIVSGFTIFGFVVGADTVLLNHEGRQRNEEDLVRGVARRELAKRGIMASETEIERWKDETRERLLRERQERGE